MPQTWKRSLLVSYCLVAPYMETIEYFQQQRVGQKNIMLNRKYTQYFFNSVLIIF